jgi:hypothetical protein
MDDPGRTIERRLLLGCVITPEGCWRNPDACVDRDGYRIVGAHSKTYKAHRLAHEIFIGPIPSGFTVDHVATRGCRYRDCINPAHLEAVTHQENSRRSSNARILLTGKCKYGHEVSGENLYVYRGYPRCRKCHALMEAKRRAGKAAQPCP